MSVTATIHDLSSKRRLQPREDEANQDLGTLTARAYRELEKQIVTLEIPPGTVVSETSLSKTLGIGRTPIREALQRLARERLVVIMPRRGIVVSEINVEAQFRILEVRRALERLLACAAARRANSEERMRLAELAGAMSRAVTAGDQVEFLRLDREFHETVDRASRNEFATAALVPVRGLSRRFWHMHRRGGDDVMETARVHVELAEAIVSGDFERAGAASDRLIDHLAAFTRAALGDA
jgi:DNA-binding GntR family transcriptional regulator